MPLRSRAVFAVLACALFACSTRAQEGIPLPSFEPPPLPGFEVPPVGGYPVPPVSNQSGGSGGSGPADPAVGVGIEIGLFAFAAVLLVLALIIACRSGRKVAHAARRRCPSGGGARGDPCAGSGSQLPLDRWEARAVMHRMEGVLSQQQRGTGRGYAVNGRAAVEALASHSPEAAAWWRTHAAPRPRVGIPVMVSVGRLRTGGVIRYGRIARLRFGLVERRYENQPDRLPVRPVRRRRRRRGGRPGRRRVPRNPRRQPPRNRRDQGTGLHRTRPPQGIHLRHRGVLRRLAEKGPAGGAAGAQGRRLPRLGRRQPPRRPAGLRRIIDPARRRAGGAVRRPPRHPSLPRHRHGAVARQLPAALRRPAAASSSTSVIANCCCRPTTSRRTYHETFPAADLAVDPAPALERLRRAVGAAERVFLDLDCDVFDPAYFPAVAEPVPFGLAPPLFLRLLDAVWSPKVAGVFVSEFDPARDRDDRGLALLMWLLEYLLLRRYESSEE